MSVSYFHVDKADMETGIKKIARNVDPGGYVLIRISPSDDVIDLIGERPAFLVHAPAKEYPAHVVGNIAEDHSLVAPQLSAFLKKRKVKKNARVVVVAVEREDVSNSLRNARIDAVVDGVQAYRPKVITVPSYSFQHARLVYEQEPNADAYIALSNELAVNLKHLREVGNDRPFTVVGHDDSALAREAGISSFNQKISEVGPVIVAKLMEHYKNEGGVPFKQRDFQTTLEVRGDR